MVQSVMGIVHEFYAFVKKRWMFFFTPVFIAIILIVILALVTEDSTIAPFVYTLF